MSDLMPIPDDEPIPLSEGPSSPVQIIHATRKSPEGGEARQVRGKRHTPRRHMDNVEVCLSTHDASGRTDHIDCPLFDVSQDGIAVVCDRRVTIGTRCYVSYRTVSHQPVHVGGVIKNCSKMEAARYRIGILLDRRLRNEEQKPAKCLSGRSVSPTHHGRKLRGAVSAAESASTADFAANQPVIREPTFDSGSEDYDLTPE